MPLKKLSVPRQSRIASTDTSINASASANGKAISRRRALPLLGALGLASAQMLAGSPLVWAADNKAAATATIKLALIEGMSGPFANTGEMVLRNLTLAVNRVNARGGVQVSPEQAAQLQIVTFDSKGQPDEALNALRAAADQGMQFILQGNSSAVAEALIGAIDKNNVREPDNRQLFLNFSAVEPSLTNEKCSFWHFRFDAHAGMRVRALMEVLKNDESIKKVYLFGQDYNFGHAVLKEARQQLKELRPDIQIVAEEYHPIGRIKDFTPYGVKIKASGAQAVITGNWGNDLTLFVKAASEVGFDGSFYTFYGNAMGAPAAMGKAGEGKVYAVADWLPNMPTRGSKELVQEFRARYPNPRDDYAQMRMQLMIEALAKAIEAAHSTDPEKVAYALEKTTVELFGQQGHIRADDHQFQQSLVVGRMAKAGTAEVPFDAEGSGYGFQVIRTFSPEEAAMPTSCQMKRP